jgi:hypothetical protein
MAQKDTEVKVIRFKFLLLIVCLFILSSTACSVDNKSGEEKGETTAMQIPEEGYKRPERYSNISSAPSYIKVSLRDVNTNKLFKMIARNDDLASFFAEEKRVPLNMYADFMTQNEGKILDIDMPKFEKFIGRIRFGDESRGKTYLSDLVFEKAMSFEQLGVESEKELIEKYFDYDYTTGLGVLKAEYYQKYTTDPAFIVLLIELNYDAFQGDIVPNLNIYKKPLV